MMVAGGKKDVGENAKSITVTNILVQSTTSDAIVEDIDEKKNTDMVAFIVNAVLRGASVCSGQ